MGNVLRDQGSYFSILTEFVDSGCLRELSPSAVKLHEALYYFAQKHTAVQLEISNSQIQRVTGLDTKSIQSAREQLVKNSRIVPVLGSMCPNNAARGVANELTQEGKQQRPATTTAPEMKCSVFQSALTSVTTAGFRPEKVSVLNGEELSLLRVEAR